MDPTRLDLTQEIEPQSNQVAELRALLDLLNPADFVEGQEERPSRWGPQGILTVTDLYLLTRAIAEFEARLAEVESWVRHYKKIKTQVKAQTIR